MRVDQILAFQQFVALLPWAMITVLFSGIIGAVVAVTRAVTRAAILRDIERHMDEETRETITKWKAEVESFRTENRRLKKRINALVAMIRGAQGVLSGIEAEPTE